MNVNSEKLKQILLTFVHFVHFDEVAWRQSSLLLDFKFNFQGCDYYTGGVGR